MNKYLDYEGFEYALRKLVADLDIPDVSNFITKTDLDNTLSGYATQSWVNEQISEITSGSITSSEVTTMINNSLSEYVKADMFATINGQSIINGGNITISGGDGTGLSTEDQEFIDMLKKYIAETNSSGKQLVPISDLAKFFGELYNDNAGLWNGDSSRSAANFYIYDFDGESKLFNGNSFRISLASSSYAGVMSATDKTRLDGLWTAYESGALGGGGDINLSAYASKDLLVDWLKALANDGYYISWHHVAGDRSLNFHTAYITDADGGITSIVRNQLNFPVVESDDIINIKVLTSAEYSALGTKDSNTMYCITD